MQHLVRFLDGTRRTCERSERWRPFSVAGFALEWCPARAGEECVVLVRLYDDDGPIIGANLASDEGTEVDARHLLAAYGGRSKLLESGAPAPRRPVRDEETATNADYPDSLVRLGFISDEEITDFLSQQCRVPTIDLSEYVVAPEIIARLSRKQCTTLHVLPVSRAGTSLIVAMVDPTNMHAIAELKRATGMAIEPVIASAAAIDVAIERYYGAND